MNYLLKFSYLGTHFEGYQRQGIKRTVQAEIENNLSAIFDEEIIIYASGRTDSGVHAINQYAHFISNKVFSCQDIKYKMNKRLATDVHIKEVYIKNDDFHARFNVKSKTYVYKINTGEHNPFEDHLFYDVYVPINIEKLNEIKEVFIGQHNFMNFTSKIEDSKNFVRTINSVKIEMLDNKIIIVFNGDGFMKYEIRMLVGNMLYYAMGRKSKDEIVKLLNSAERHITSCCAPSEGLYLMEVYYE